MITKNQFNKYFGIGMIALCVGIMVLLISTAIKNGTKTIRSSCENLVLKGVSTIDELLKTAVIKD